MAVVALFYLAFVQFDITRLRAELISIYTVDSARRVVTESVLPWLMQKAMGSSNEIEKLKKLLTGLFACSLFVRIRGPTRNRRMLVQ